VGLGRDFPDGVGRIDEPFQSHRLTTQRESDEVQLRQKRVELRKFGLARPDQLTRRNEDGLIGVPEGSLSTHPFTIEAAA
jgi:hypothetical protein